MAPFESATLVVPHFVINPHWVGVLIPPLHHLLSSAIDNLPASEQNVIVILLNSIADLKFLNNSDRFIVSRDFMSVKGKHTTSTLISAVWDLANTTAPAEVYPVQSHLRPYLNSIYETELLFDDFKLSLSSDDR